MGIMDQVEKEARRAADATKKGAEKIGGIARLKYQLLNLRSRRSALYEQIGQLHVEQLEQNRDNTAVVSSLAAQVGQLSEEILAKEEELAALQNTEVCPCCSAHVRSDSAFCPKCGQKLHENAKSENE